MILVTNIVQAVKKCYKIKIDYRDLRGRFLCFFAASYTTLFSILGFFVLQMEYRWSVKGVQLQCKWSTVGVQKDYILKEREVFYVMKFLWLRQRTA